MAAAYMQYLILLPRMSGNGYQVQDLPDRYIRTRTLVTYLNSRLDEFGKEWTLQASVSADETAGCC